MVGTLGVLDFACGKEKVRQEVCLTLASKFWIKLNTVLHSGLEDRSLSFQSRDVTSLVHALHYSTYQIPLLSAQPSMKSTARKNLTFIKQGTSIKGSIAKPTARPAISRIAFAAAALGPQGLHFENDTLTR